MITPHTIKRLKQALLTAKKRVVKSPTRERVIFGGAVALSLVIIVGISVALLRDPLPESNSEGGGGEVVVVEAPVYRHPLTGEVLDWTGGAVGPGYEALPQVFGVMIENSSEAWPLAGLDEAFLVIEAPVEANIPRFIAFFSDEYDVNKIGPVRSARPYYLDWNDELDAIYGHVGGSPDALNLIAKYGTLDLNEFAQGEYYYRQNGTRYAPHNVYTNSGELSLAVEEIIRLYQLGDSPPSYESWLFKNDEPMDVDPVIGFNLDWSDGSTYDLSWDYVAETNAYTRTQKAARAFLEGGAEVVVNNVIVLETDVTVLDAQGRRRLTTVGEGKASVFQDGNQIEATWRKDERTSRLRFYDAAGGEIAMNAGKTWIEVVDSLSKVTLK